MEVIVAHLDNPDQLDESLRSATLVLNAAGPYSLTALPIVNACIRNKTHYLDVSGELPVIERLAGMNTAAINAGIMLMPAVGYAVVPSDCMALKASRLVHEPTHLRIALSHFELFATGSAKSMLELVRNSVKVRRNGQMTNVAVGSLEKSFDFGSGMSVATAINWSDSFTAYYATGIPNIEVYLEANIYERWMYALSSASSVWIRQPVTQAWLATQAEWVLSARSKPSLEKELAGRRRCLIVEVCNAAGHTVQLRLSSPDPYTVTRQSAVEIMHRVMARNFKPGFQTPAAMYGDSLLKVLSGLQIDQCEYQQ